jgi:hypothetical protein
MFGLQEATKPKKEIQVAFVERDQDDFRSVLLP